MRVKEPHYSSTGHAGFGCPKDNEGEKHPEASRN
jgi:hypothetical protein